MNNPIRAKFELASSSFYACPCYLQVWQRYHQRWLRKAEAIFFTAQGHATPKWLVRYDRNSNSSEILCLFSLPVSLIWFGLCWGLTSQSTIFQSCRDGATASWVINQYFWGVKCLAQGHNTAAVGFEPPTSRSGVRHFTTEPPRSPPVSLMKTEILVTKKRWRHHFPHSKAIGTLKGE